MGPRPALPEGDVSAEDKEPVDHKCSRQPAGVSKRGGCSDTACTQPKPQCNTPRSGVGSGMEPEDTFI